MTVFSPDPTSFFFCKKSEEKNIFWNRLQIKTACAIVFLKLDNKFNLLSFHQLVEVDADRQGPVKLKQKEGGVAQMETEDLWVSYREAFGRYGAIRGFYVDRLT